MFFSIIMSDRLSNKLWQNSKSKYYNSKIKNYKYSLLVKLAQMCIAMFKNVLFCVIETPSGEYMLEQLFL